MRSKIVLGLLVATIAYAYLLMAGGADVEAAGGSYLLNGALLGQQEFFEFTLGALLRVHLSSTARPNW
jgi:hypothetical protein